MHTLYITYAVKFVFMTGITSTESGSSHILSYEEKKRMCTMKQNSLIIDGNAVYEMDMDCLKKRRQFEEQPKEKRERKRERTSNRISIRNVDE